MLLWVGAGSGKVWGTGEEAVALVTGEWPPYTGENLDGGGVAVELVNAVFTEMGKASTIGFFPWRRCEAYVRTGQAWATFPYAITGARQSKYLFSNTIFQSHSVWFYYGDKMRSVNFTDLDSLQPYTIGVASGYWYEGWIRDAGLTVDESPDDLIALKKLKLGRIDLYPMDKHGGIWLINKYFPGDEGRFGILENPIRDNDNALMVSKTYPHSERLLEEFNAALQSVKDKGIDRRILDKFRFAPPGGVQTDQAE